MFMQLARYNTQQTYSWNYEHAPDPVIVDEPRVPGKWTYCGRPVGSPLAIAAGPLLNGRWCLYYAGLGFDTVTYKTVRSGLRPCYPLPNLQPVRAAEPLEGDRVLQAAPEFEGSWAVSFGMPSQPPEVWRRDIAETRRHLPPHKLLSVSVVGTVQPDWSIEQLAEDYATCSQDAAEHGADVIEINLSCPNVNTCDGQLYQQPRDAAVIARRVRQAIGDKPLVAKVGYFARPAESERLLEALAGDVTAIAATNCIAAKVVDGAGRAFFDGQPRGIAGKSILDACVRQTEMIADGVAQLGLVMRVIGVGGIFTAGDVCRYVSAGAEAVQLATAAMIDPEVGLKIRSALQQQLAAPFAHESSFAKQG
jgi:dihydroorotate dehydrogenase